MAGSNNSFIAKFLRMLIKFGIAGAVIYLLFRGDSGRIVESLRRFDFLWLLPAVFFYALHMIVVAWRWRRLVKMTGIEMSFSAAVSLTLQGNFFSLVIPGGAIGGDVVKMAAVSRRLGDGARTEGAFSVLMDRIIGMLALFVLALALLFPVRPLFYGIRIAGLPEKLTGDLLFWLIFLLSLTGLEFGLFFALDWYWSCFEWSPLGHETSGLEGLVFPCFVWPSFLLAILLKLGLLQRWKYPHCVWYLPLGICGVAALLFFKSLGMGIFCIVLMFFLPFLELYGIRRAARRRKPEGEK